MARKLDIDTKKEWEEKTKQRLTENKCRILDTIEPVKYNRIKPAQDKMSASHAATLTNNGKCYYCKGTHYIYRCFKWLGLSIPDRLRVKTVKIIHKLSKSKSLC